MYFSIHEPTAPETPVVVEVPHAGLSVDAEALGTLIAPARSLGRDADLYADELFHDAPAQGATLLRSHVSRYVCDLNRSLHDLDYQTNHQGPSRAAPHGLVWRRTTDGRPALSTPLTDQELERRLANIYRPYHQAIAQLLDLKRERFGYAILLCGHTMPTFGRLGERRADVVPGSRSGTSTSPLLLRAIEAVAAEHRLGLEHDVPYRGGFSTATYGRPELGVHALQVELSRGLYMDEATLQRREPGFMNTRRFCAELVARLGNLQLPLPQAPESLQEAWDDAAS